MWPRSSYADWHDRDDQHDHEHDHDGEHNHDGEHGHEGWHQEHEEEEHERDRWRGHSFVGFNFSVLPDNYYYRAHYYPTPDQVFVSSPVYEPVGVNGRTYYLNNGTYYVYNGYSYQAVATPVTVVQQPVEVIQPATVVESQAQGVDFFTINIPNDKGGYTAVRLKKSGNGYIGPQGEFYSEFPKVSQLKVIYGK